MTGPLENSDPGVPAQFDYDETPPTTDYQRALTYISSPTMGLPPGRDALDFVDEASEVNVRLALKACIRTARMALEAATDGRPIWRSCALCAEIHKDWPGFSASGLRRLHVQHGHAEAGDPSQQVAGNDGGVS